MPCHSRRLGHKTPLSPKKILKIRKRSKKGEEGWFLILLLFPNRKKSK
jgi:hypothetical protein